MKVIIKEIFITLERGSHRLIARQDGIGKEKDRDKEVGKEDKEDKEEITIIISDRMKIVDMKIAQEEEQKEWDKEITVNNNTPPQATTMA